ncbi:MAG: two-component system sensor histidine kinase PmrB [Aeromonadaceae bacterium]|nr:two-component system sensor histidine kinase PmrB [Aeromonadaceae bacterium]
MMAPWRTLRGRLITLLALIFLLGQTLLVLRVWHESQEQVYILAKAALDQQMTDAELAKESAEAMEALLLTSAGQSALMLLLAYVGISWLVAPLNRLCQQLATRDPGNLQPILLSGHTQELQSVTQVINQLFAKLSLTLQRERQFTADVAHELRTPLAGIKLTLELLERDGVTAVTPLIARLDDLHRSVAQLLEMSRLEPKFVMGLQEELELVSGVIEPLRPELERLADEAQMQIQWQLQAGWIKGEADLLRHLLRNLVENAARYAQGSQSIQISVSQEGSQICLRVADEGPGVPEAELTRLTDAFRRLDRRGSGVGLGLNLVARICQLHSASLQFSNRPGGGLLVAVGFPGLAQRVS